MIEFRTLGTLDLRGSEGQKVLSVLSQPRRLALLAYLAVATPRGFHRRDKLLGLFWAERKDASARHALNQALYVLRQSLGKNTLMSRGTEEVALSWDEFWCDARALDDAVSTDHPETVLELYRGHLLEGFFLSEAPGFEKWLEAERGRLREAVATAAWELAHRHLAAGRVTEGERVGQRALTLVPTDENEVRRFVQALTGAGDRAAAVRFYEKFSRDLEDEVGLRPAAESRHLVEKIRASMELPAAGRAAPRALEPEPEPESSHRHPASPPLKDARQESGFASQLGRLKAALADRYGVEREIGSGRTATVYLAQDLRHHRPVALKVLDPELAATIGAERFLREIETAAKLIHPHILPLFDSGQADGLLFYVMPYVEGESLRARLDREGQLPIDDAVRIAREIADALAYAHDHGVVHRDVKPANILLEAGHAVLADFGVAQAVAVADETRLTATGVSLGTPSYMSPEQAAGAGDLDGRSDQYGLGCVLYEMLAGEPPFTGKRAESVVRQHLVSKARPIREIRRTVPEAVEVALGKALAKAPTDRFGTTDELFRVLDDHPHTSTSGRSFRRGWRVRLLAAGVATVAALLTWRYVQDQLYDATVALDSQRVVVAPLRNETGEPSLDVAGVMAGHVITQALQQTGLVQTVPWPEARQASQLVTATEGGAAMTPIRALADETGAGIVISGSMYRMAGNVQYRVEVTDAIRGRHLAAPAPQSSPMDAPGVALQALTESVLGALAASLDERLATQESAVSRPPTFEAYRAFNRGFEFYTGRGMVGPEWRREAIGHFSRAFELDTTFVTPLIYVALMNVDGSRLSQADSVLNVIGPYEGGLNGYDREWVRYLRARVGGRDDDALHAMRRAARLAPGSKATYNLAYLAEVRNRPREALEAILSLDPERGPMRGWTFYWYRVAFAYEALGEYELELEAARQARRQYPGATKDWAFFEARALAAMGRLNELDPAVEAGLYDQGGNRWLAQLLDYLSLDGLSAPEREVADRAIDWFRSTMADQTEPTNELRRRYGWALFAAGHVEEARGVLDALVRDFPTAVEDRGRRGVIAAIQGDSLQARDDAEWLGGLHRPYLDGWDSYYLGAIAGVLGDTTRAMDLVRRAFEEGRSIRPFEWIWYDALRDHPPFREFLKPKG